jgi:hypothetical protein
MGSPAAKPQAVDQPPETVRTAEGEEAAPSEPVVVDPLPGTAVTSEPAEAEAEQGVLYADSFDDVAGSIARITNGKGERQGPPGTRVVMPFQGLPDEGVLVLQVAEDAATLGPNEQPGVLALSWQEIPAGLKYSGFVYQGTTKQRITLPVLATAKDASDLTGLRLKFRYRGDNYQGNLPLTLKINFRLEPNLPDSFNKRLDFGNITPTDAWQEFDMALWEGTNADAFLKSIAEGNPANFKVVWGQAGPLANYHPGDTLLIDDLAIVEMPENRPQ